MADELLKFRCYRCNQLLAVAQTRAGKVVSCPKCKADLQIPALEPVATGEAGPGAGVADAERRRSDAGPGAPGLPAPAQSPALPAFLEGVAGNIPPEVAELRPEDLRVEADALESFPRRSPPDDEPPSSSAQREPRGLFPAIESPEGPAGWPSAQELANAFAAAAPAVEPERTVPPPLAPVTLPPVEKAPAVAPPIEIEPPSVLKDDRPTRHVREVVVPASVLMLWWLFGLAGLALSFIAGLMIGHFIWKPP